MPHPRAAVRPRRTAAAALAALVLGCAGPGAPAGGSAQPPAPPTLVSWFDVTGRPVAPATTREAYGGGPQQFGDLRLPAGAERPGAARVPVAVVVHGGCWHNGYGLDPYSHLAAALAAAGVATWTVEYRRLGDAGGGWPGTFADVAAGVDHVRRLAERYALDTARVVLVGHSAGGQLALWAAARGPLPRGAPADAPAGATLRPRGVVSLSGIADLAAYAGPSGCQASVPELLGGLPADQPGRYAAVDPAARVPLGVPSRLLHGALDPIVPPGQSTGFAERARRAGDDAQARLVDGAGHYELIAPWTAAWATVAAEVRRFVQ